MEGELVPVARVIKPHGIRGEIVAAALSDVPGRLAAGVEVVIGAQAHTVTASRHHHGRLLLALDGIDDRTGAERLRGRDILAAPVDLSGTDTYWVHELVGMAVADADGTALGTVVAAVELPKAAGYDLLEVARDDGATWLLPAVEDYVQVRDGDDGREMLVLVDAPEGLADVTLRDRPDGQGG